MDEPPGEPSAATGRRAASSTMTGAIEERGRLPPATAFATGAPSTTGRYEKSVSWLSSTNPPTARPEPNSDSTVVVIETMFPSPSITTKWDVPLASIVASAPRWIGAGTPAAGAGPGAAPINAARRAKYPASSNPSTGTGTNAGSAIQRSRSAYIRRLAIANRYQASGSCGPRDAMSVRSRMPRTSNSAMPDEGGGGTHTMYTRYGPHTGSDTRGW